MVASLHTSALIVVEALAVKRFTHLLGLVVRALELAVEGLAVLDKLHELVDHRGKPDIFRFEEVDGHAAVGVRFGGMCLHLREGEAVDVVRRVVLEEQLQSVDLPLGELAQVGHARDLVVLLFEVDRAGADLVNLPEELAQLDERAALHDAVVVHLKRALGLVDPVEERVLAVECAHLALLA